MWILRHLCGKTLTYRDNIFELFRTFTDSLFFFLQYFKYVVSMSFFDNHKEAFKITFLCIYEPIQSSLCCWAFSNCFYHTIHIILKFWVWSNLEPFIDSKNKYKILVDTLYINTLNTWNNPILTQFLSYVFLIIFLGSYIASITK